MKKVVLSLISLTLASYAAQAQVTVIVNPDGKHSVQHQHGNTGVIVNPDGTHSTVHSHGSNTAIVVNTDGTHSSLHNHGAVSILVNPDGTHSVVPNHSNNPILVKPNRKYTRSERKSKKKNRRQ